MTFDLWVLSDFDGEWERHNARPFMSEKEALRWAKRYIPNATYEVRQSGSGKDER